MIGIDPRIITIPFIPVGFLYSFLVNIVVLLFLIFHAVPTSHYQIQIIVHVKGVDRRAIIII